MNIRISGCLIAPAIVLTLAACSSQPTRVDDLETARFAVQQVEASPDAGKYAAVEVTAAHDALLEADRLAAANASVSDVQHAAYLAKRHADIAAELIARGQAEQKTAAAESERERVTLQAREQEAQRTAAALEAQLRELQAKQTDRGLVLTLGDVLFDSGQSTLKPGAASTIDRLATFLSQAPERSVAIEGHTDSVGAESYNLSLSENRANSVKAALVAKGIDAERIVTVGKGEGVPVAGNDNSAGRQQNRRVEIIVSNPTELVRNP